MQQPISRRNILTLGGTGLVGAASLAMLRTADASGNETVRIATERNYRPLVPGQSHGFRIAQIDPAAGGGRSRLEAALDRPWIDENAELIILVRAALPDDLVGRRRVLRAMMIGDNSDLRIETVGPDTRIDHPSFEVEIALGPSDPIRDWNLIRERIFSLRVSMNVLDSSDFAVSNDFLFKVRRA